ncbi:hypothetical protein [Almyronema epifaneia]|uniref:Uncharacterized protein n=1 Tax=Almyronema epifaneia S1 TaxID=2991925 RepID=A0ABW6IFJ3_9CYAN
MSSGTKALLKPPGQSLASAASPLVKKSQCGCGKAAGLSGKCSACQQRRLATQTQSASSQTTEEPTRLHEIGPLLFSPPALSRSSLLEKLQPSLQTNRKNQPAPTKATGERPHDTRQKPEPEQGSATIQCNGSGGYEVVLNNWAGAACGTEGCVRAHEQSHIADWQAKWPTGCQGQPRGYLPKGDPPDNPLMTVAEYQAFLKESECKAHTVDLTCAEALPKTGGCRQTVNDYIRLTKTQKANWCPGLSRLAKVLLGIGGGALAGAGIGALIGGGLGAGIGAGIGALIGGIAGGLL